jgi:hypothetical protein
MLQIAALGCLLAGSVMGETSLILRNNQPFPVHMPVRFSDCAPGDAKAWPVSDHEDAQAIGRDIVLIANIDSSTHQEFQLRQGSPLPADRAFKIQPVQSSIELSYRGKSMGRLEWGLIFFPIRLEKGETNEPQDFAADFHPLPLAFKRMESGPVCDEWRSEIRASGLAMQFELLAYYDGFLDIHACVTNEAADASVKTYAAIVCRWVQPGVATQTMCYDNHILPLPAPGRSPFRAGPGRYQFVQHGVDWVQCRFADGPTAAWLNGFAPSFTIIDNTTNNALHAPRYAGANLSQLSQEVERTADADYFISEIARSDTRVYSARPTENVLPLRGEGVSFSSRICLTASPKTSDETDHAFVAYNSYNAQTNKAGTRELSLGVPFMRFGTSYFPYSTLGENFDDQKLPGMDRESFWPLAADTVLQWRLFADDIRRDLRIAKAMGFQSIRLHHLELLGGVPAATRQEYLDFLFSELRGLKLRALVDIYASPEQLAALTRRYGDVIDGIELENEVLIWGIPLDRPEQWKAEYAAVKSVAPQIPVNLTGYNNTGMFDRLKNLGVPFDRVDLHSYIDSLDAIPSGRGYALAMGSYGSREGKAPMISEWNWRALTKMSEAERARIYPPIMENALSTRAIPDFYQFQFNETMAPNPRVGRGNLLRHYELLNLSRRPKLEALEFMKLIARYSAPDDPIRLLSSPHLAIELPPTNRATINFSVTNLASGILELRATSETSAGLQAYLVNAASIRLGPGQSTSLPVEILVTNRIPGFYHVFVRLEAEGGLLRYLWAEIRVPGAPKMADGPALPIDLSKPVVVLFGAKATVLEVETAFAIGETLESATGRVVPILPAESRPKDDPSQVVFVGMEKELPPANDHWLFITGANSRQVEQNGMNFILRYWKYAKDSASARVGLIRKELPRGGDAAKLP